MHRKKKRKRGVDRENPIDWNKLKLEYMSSNISINALRLKHDLSYNRSFMNKTKGWIEERDKMHQEIIERAKEKIIQTGVKQWTNQIQLWKGIEFGCALVLKQIKESGKVAPRDLDNLASALEKSLRSQKLIQGESTNIEEQRNIHLDVVKLIEEAEKENE